ncbi:LLM class flavin-dependent oxidoreductase [Variovorax ginsengisoli]|uniref:Alkanesulfonate monooxygenase SsuD/methylene tetrahydromethanopterin reductase-like flavin-dependent oxidoreductase (Luciferase family) n=1 Tax=Variovorax ginsengisoli TaxID=363844 RepID=A0ABT9SG30_9BURK|nr:LLM class flavin-dependent oxidoreductase [Variovorax ginsengisoli]MDP9902748.1 alkanesulfonate monooxygenase SsuD/methylene tetrahydromethanopterin reductase-like flavin-dependent oxidoreductase (luciferase family) [Variovorax ginsengisoli]
MTTSSMRYGVFLNVENPDANAAEALQQMLRTATAAEASGFDELWLAEHHHSAFAIGSAPMVLLSHLAARTSRVRLGTGASLLALNDPIRVAEDVATLDVLSGGRIEFGVARGGPFPLQYRHAGVPSAEVARDRMHEALLLIRRLWREERVHFDGRFYRCADLTIAPWPLQRPVPVWLASLSDDSRRLAAAEGHGLMATPSSDVGAVAAVVQGERVRRADFPFAIARFFHCEPDHAQAVARGLAAVREYPQRMGVRFGKGGMPPMFEPDASDAVILANAVIGDPAHCAQRVEGLRRALGPHRLLLKPALHDEERVREGLALFMRRVVPVLGEAT